VDATTMPTTNDFAPFRFDASFGSDDLPVICIRPLGKNLDVLADARLFLNLRKGVDMDQAEALAARLNELVNGIEYVHYHGGLS
jgi:hypothetical protein